MYTVAAIHYFWVRITSSFFIMQVLDRVAGEQVGLMFDAIEQSLYEGHSTGYSQIDWECMEWRTNFPHLRYTRSKLVMRKYVRMQGCIYDKCTKSCALLKMKVCVSPVISLYVRVKGIHLLDSLDDGTEIVDPVVVETEDLSSDQCSESHSELAIIGHAMKMHPPPTLLTGNSFEELPGLHYEEILALDGEVEEYFAYNYSTT